MVAPQPQPLLPLQEIQPHPQPQPQQPQTEAKLVRVHVMHDDGYAWHRKSSQLLSKGTITARYYVCAIKTCPARKNVKYDKDDRIIDVTYRGEHNHPPPQVQRPLGETPQPLPIMPLGLPDHSSRSPSNDPGLQQLQAGSSRQMPEDSTVTYPQIPYTVPIPRELARLFSHAVPFTRHVSIHPALEAVFMSDHAQDKLQHNHFAIVIDSTSRFVEGSRKCCPHTLEAAVVLVHLGSRLSPFAGGPDATLAFSPMAILPAAFLCTTDHSVQGYARLLRRLVEMVPTLSPTFVSVDLTSPWYEAVCVVFPEARPVCAWPVTVGHLQHWIESAFQSITPSSHSIGCADPECSDASDHPGTSSFDVRLEDIQARTISALRHCSNQTDYAAFDEAVRHLLLDVPEAIREGVQARFQEYFLAGERYRCWSLLDKDTQAAEALHIVNAVTRLYSPRLCTISCCLCKCPSITLGYRLAELSHIFYNESELGLQSFEKAMSEGTFLNHGLNPVTPGSAILDMTISLNDAQHLLTMMADGCKCCCNCTCTQAEYPLISKGPILPGSSGVGEAILQHRVGATSPDAFNGEPEIAMQAIDSPPPSGSD